MAKGCYLCGKEEENCDNILLHYFRFCLSEKKNFCTVVWHLLSSLFDVSSVFPLKVKDMLLSWCFCLVGKQRRKVWHVAPLCLIQTILWERDRRAFDYKETYIHGIEFIFYTIFGRGHLLLYLRALLLL